MISKPDFYSQFAPSSRRDAARLHSGHKFPSTCLFFFFFQNRYGYFSNPINTSAWVGVISVFLLVPWHQATAGRRWNRCRIKIASIIFTMTRNLVNCLAGGNESCAWYQWYHDKSKRNIETKRSHWNYVLFLTHWCLRSIRHVIRCTSTISLNVRWTQVRLTTKARVRRVSSGERPVTRRWANWWGCAVSHAQVDWLSPTGSRRMSVGLQKGSANGFAAAPFSPSSFNPLPFQPNLSLSLSLSCYLVVAILLFSRQLGHLHCPHI